MDGDTRNLDMETWNMIRTDNPAMTTYYKHTRVTREVETLGNTAGTNRHNDTGGRKTEHRMQDCQNKTGNRLRCTAQHWARGEKQT